MLIISRSAIALSAIKFLGVGYLAYLGLKTLAIDVETQKVGVPHKHKDISAFRTVKIGLLTNILSPKASLFFASIFATVFSAGSPFWLVVFLWIAMPLNSFIMASILSVFFTQKKVRSVYASYQQIINKLLGLALLLLAIMIAIHK